ncbi:MAG: hypothetical protein HWE18_15225 [Gammaproteobacteria bacterium]|nr:hypothetical protein [Gammaproteobacteria bacterium]
MLKKVLSITSFAALAACGSGSSGPSTGTIQGLAGLDYKTQSQSGVLNASGEYRYNKGETVTLSLGDMVVAEFAAGNSDIASVLGLDQLPNTALAVRSALRTPEYTRERIENSYVVKKGTGTFNQLHRVSNLMRLLIALDNDNDGSNGYDITAQRDNIAGLNLNLEASLYEFAANADAMKFQHETGISLGMDAARPLREAYDLADISLAVPERISKNGQVSYTYNAQGKIAGTSENQTSDSITEYTYTYSSESGEIAVEDLTVLPYGESSSYSPFRRVTTSTYTNFGLLETQKVDTYKTNSTTEIESYTSQSNDYMDDKVYLTAERTISYTNTIGAIIESYSDRWEYNDDFNITSRARYSGTTPQNETFKYGTDITYDPAGKLYSSNYENTNSNTQTSHDYSYSKLSEDVNLVTRVYTKNDGSKEEIIEKISNGVLVEKTVNQLTSEDVVTNTQSVIIRYDTEGRISQCYITRDTNADNTLDAKVTSVFNYSEAGLASIENAYDNNADGTVDYESTKSVNYGDNGEVVEDLDGNTFTYGNVSQDGIGYLIFEYLNSVLSSDHGLYFYDTDVKCEKAGALSEA